MSKADVTLSFCCTLSEAKPIYREAARRRISVSRLLRLLLTTRSDVLDKAIEMNAEHERAWEQSDKTRRKTE
jgi:hypothetical protein